MYRSTEFHQNRCAFNFFSYNFRGGLTTPKGGKCGNPYTYILYNVIKYSNTKFHQNRCISNFLMFNIWWVVPPPGGADAEILKHVSIKILINTQKPNFNEIGLFLIFFSYKLQRGRV